ncbi:MULTISPECIES: hypothetical protein [Sorangium]|uniref:Secreted protein n=1 Tax=Sorangium cellulosum TaxID=56 RepID=A0A4P2QTT6_SORCE|nr:MULTISPECIES: hypothetical protein [Sorangium]AUX33516.1 uncharacterized protein SOCE836_056760 [Sorangium cellulosum]WCQ92832.1 hypothetical protein NQZ70_05578 [Sorangium sp. Soce836]
MSSSRWRVAVTIFLPLALAATALGCPGGGALPEEDEPAAGSSGGVADTSCESSPDGICDRLAGETCACRDCAVTAWCTPFQCSDDLVCGLEDACTCADCHQHVDCSDPSRSNCTDDGVCDAFLEGCRCEDCKARPECEDAFSGCGQPTDGICGDDDRCGCIECLGSPRCSRCSSVSYCTVSDPCYCDKCLDDPVCSDPQQCDDDGLCVVSREGCGCADCASLPECAAVTGLTGAGGGGGGAGGGGGEKGAGGSEKGAGGSGAGADGSGEAGGRGG